MLGDLLQLSFVVDPSVQGTVTLQTGRPIHRSAVLPTLQNALALDGIALVGRDGIWRLVPMPTRARGKAGGAGGRVITRIVSPRSSPPPTSRAFCSRCCRPAPRCAPMRHATRRSERHRPELSDILDDVAIFDVDALRGVSFALLPLADAQAADVAREVASLIGAAGAGIAGAGPCHPDRPAECGPGHVDAPGVPDAGTRLVSEPGSQRRQRRAAVYVYRVQNGRATDLATVLDGIGIAGSARRRHRRYRAAGGRTAAGAQAVTPGCPKGPSRVRLPDSGLPNDTATPRGRFNSAPRRNSIRVTADEANDALLISATPQDFSVIESACKNRHPAAAGADRTPPRRGRFVINELSFGYSSFAPAADFRSAPTSRSHDDPSNTSAAGTPTSVLAPRPCFPLRLPAGANLAVASNGGVTVT